VVIKNAKKLILTSFLLLAVAITSLQVQKGIASKKSSAATSTTVEGYLRVFHSHNLESKKSDFKYYLQKDDLSMILLDYNGESDIKPGSRIKATGTMSTQESMSLSSSTTSGGLEVVSAPDATITTIQTTGAKKIAIIQFQFSDQPFISPTKDVLLNGFNTTVRNYYLETSYNQFDISADAYGTYLLGTSSTCDSGLLVQSAINAADADINFNNYDQILLNYRGNVTCHLFWAWTTPVTFTTAEGNKNLLVSATQDYLSPLPNIFYDAVIHELGHNLGFEHANGFDCGFVSMGSIVDRNVSMI